MKNLMFISTLFFAYGILSAQNVVYVYPGTDQISYAIQFEAYPGDIIELTEGDYIETKTVPISIDLTIRGAEDATVKWLSPGNVDAISLRANLHLENIIFQTERDERDLVNCILNEFGSVTPGQEDAAVKNNLYVNHCQFIGYYHGIYVADPVDLGDNIAHPLDTLYVTDCLFYGGGSFRASRSIMCEYRQIHVARVQYCTFWNMERESIKIYGHENPDETPGILDYCHFLVNHCTFFDAGTDPIPTGNGVGAYYKYTDADDSVKNCIFYDISDFAIKAADGSFTETYYDYNTADSCGWKPGCGTCQAWHPDIINSVGPNSEIRDPMLTDPDNGDFRLKDGSPAIGTASDGSDRGNTHITVWNPGTWIHDPVGIRDDLPLKPAEFVLYQNNPNPFNPNTTIQYSLKRTDQVKLEIFDVSGRKVRTLVNQFMPSGFHSAEWDGLDDQGNQVSTGPLFYRLQSGVNMKVKKMMLLK